MEKSQARPPPRRPAINQRHAPPPKRRGEIAERAFMQRAISLGFGVAKPWGTATATTTYSTPDAVSDKQSML